MPFMGQHSQNPNGNPQFFAQMAQLPPEILDRIAKGGRFTKAESEQFFGIHGEANFAPGSKKEPEMAATRDFASSLMRGDTQRASALSQQASATHKDWEGGTAIKLAPVAAAFIPGIGPLAAAGIGAAIGGATSAAHLNNQPILGSAAQGGALAGAANVAKNYVSGALKGGPPAVPGAPGAASTTGTPGGGVGRVANQVGNTVSRVSQLGSQLAGTARQLGAGGGAAAPGGGGMSLGNVAQLGLAGLGTIGGAQDMGTANDLRQQALRGVQLQPLPPDLSSTFEDPSNPFARPSAGRSQGAARASLLR